MEKKEIIKRILEFEDDELIDFYIEAAEQRIMNDCWLDEFPEELDHVVVEMVVQKIGNGTIDGVTSVKRGDTSMSFDTSDAFHKVLERYEGELQKFRKVRVT